MIRKRNQPDASYNARQSLFLDQDNATPTPPVRAPQTQSNRAHFITLPKKRSTTAKEKQPKTETTWAQDADP